MAYTCNDDETLPILTPKAIVKRAVEVLKWAAYATSSNDLPGTTKAITETVHDLESLLKGNQL